MFYNRRYLLEIKPAKIERDVYKNNNYKLMMMMCTDVIYFKFSIKSRKVFCRDTMAFSTLLLIIL